MQLPYANTQIKHWNPGATLPLILPVHVICNTSDEDIYENIRINSRRPGKWVQLNDAHDRVAVICGSGPSLADDLSEIRRQQANGAHVFALNGAARYLFEQGICPDTQIVLDARAQTAQLIGPAKQHLFASQVHPDCFVQMPTAQLWHLQVEKIDDLIPPYDDSYCLIGGAASVGNTAICLAYALGFRNLQLYGYDSCHRDNAGHAFAQPMNDGDPCAVINFGGKEYTASLTMKLQAEKFQETARALLAAGCHIEVHGTGLLPDMWRAPVPDEQQKYEQMWNYPEYRLVAPGEEAAEIFMRVVPRQTFHKVIDFGCGTGRGAMRLHKAGHPVVLVDFAYNCRDEAAQGLPFLLADLSKSMPISGDIGFCTDVLEHIPPDQLDAVIRNIFSCVPRAFFQISLVSDVMGGLIGHPLHLSVFPTAWWEQKFASLGLAIQWSESSETTASFYLDSLRK
jgi:uncharacterized Rossmann fold enzyme/SAM-dependent methyltransferase